MSLAQRFERRLESLVGSAFARVFKGQVEPVEIGSALQREAGDKRNVMGNGDVLAPNRYRVTLSPSDHDRLSPWDSQLTSSLAELVQEHLDENGWRTIGDIEVYLARDESLHTGVFGVASRMESNSPPRRRPYDSLSLPAVPGAPSEFYPNANGPGRMAPSTAAAPSASPPAAPSVAPIPGVGRFAPGQPALSSGPPWPQFPQPPVYPGAPPSPYSPAVRPPTTPAPPGTHNRALLVVDGTNQHVELRVGSNVVGRGSEADLQLLDQGVSRRHLDVQFDGNFATAYDLGSTNGTNINGHDVGSQLLRHGDVIRVGHTRLVFQQEQV